jgi:ribonuclease HII
LSVIPAHILVDGNKWKPYVPQTDCLEIPAQTIVKGDGKYLSIAAASILAKTYRDDYMMHLHDMYPNYHWDKNMGYPTKEHYHAILQFGITPYHRKTFKLIKE